LRVVDEDVAPPVVIHGQPIEQQDVLSLIDRASWTPPTAGSEAPIGR
jgi:hypothetical protein